MSSITTLSNWQPATRYTAPTPGRNGNPSATQPAPPATSAAPPSTIVTLSPEAIAAASAPISTALRYQDLGADMLKQIGAGSVMALNNAKLPDAVDNKFSLSITTRSGTKVDLTLANVGDEMIYQLSASAELSGDERKALNKLAEGFQAAIDGMAGANPQVRLGALTQFDSKFVQSIDFQAQVASGDTVPHTLDFHVDDTKRKVSIGGPDGQAEVNVDTRAFEHVGSKQQQEKAIKNYLAQFDQAATRGRGDKQLMSMFKDAFSDMNRTAISEERRNDLSTRQWWQLNADDRSTLTGLSDFSASVSQTPQYSNPLKPREEDSFSYDIAQQTVVDNRTRDERSVRQSQQSHLEAKFHTEIGKSGPPKFDGTPETQNYDYHHINDSASSNLSLDYRRGKLAKASLEQTASQSEQVQTFILGKQTAEKTIPSQQSLVRNLLSALTPYEHYKGDDRLNDNIFLLGSTNELSARDQQF